MISRAPRPCVTKLNDQRMKTSRRFWKPTRYQRWTTSHVIQARKPLSLQALDVGDRGGAADRGEVALVAVAERRRLLRRAAGRATTLRRVAALLHRDRRDARERDDAVGAAHAHHVAEREHLRVPGKREVRLDGDAARAVALRAGELGERRREAATP